jgi:peptidyl-prolyl cis-trans isomerase C
MAAVLIWASAAIPAAAEVPKIVAKVNGKTIEGEKFTKLLKQVEMAKGAPGATKGPLDPEAVKQDVLERLITVEVLTQKAEQLKIQASPQEVAKKIEEIQANMGGEEPMKEALKAHGATMEEFKADLTRSLRVQNLLEKEVFDKVKVEPAEVKGFYDANPQAFQVPEQVRARHIIVRVKEGASDAEKKEAKEAVQKAADRIQKGESFEDVAKQVSQDGSAANGGDLGYFGRGQMVPEFEQIAFAQETGKLSQVVETKFGFHLIKVEDKREARTLGFQEVEGRLEDYMKQKKGEEDLKGYIEGLRAQAKIEKMKF